METSRIARPDTESNAVVKPTVVVSTDVIIRICEHGVLRYTELNVVKEPIRISELQATIYEIVGLFKHELITLFVAVATELCSYTIGFATSKDSLSRLRCCKGGGHTKFEILLFDIPKGSRLS
jgi:hypothetical protein